jgi:hypothetical protein
VGITIESVLVRDQSLAMADLDGRATILNVHTSSYASLNAVATEIWALLARPSRVGDIFDTLSRRYDVDAMALSRDVLPFLQVLVERQLIREVEGAIGR